MARQGLQEPRTATVGDGSAQNSTADVGSAPVIAVYQRSIMRYRHEFFADLDATLQAQGFRLVVISADAPGSANGLPSPIDHRQLGNWFSLSIAGRDIKERLVMPVGLGAMLKKLRPQLVVTEDISALPGNLWVVWFRIVHGTRYLIWSLGPKILGKKRSWFRPLFAPVIGLFRHLSDGFISYSSWAADAFSNAYDKPAWTAPNSTVRRADAIRPELLDPRKFDNMNPLRLIFVGRLLPQKNLDVLIDAMAIAPVNSVLDVIGDGPDLFRLTVMVRERRLAGRVQFHGRIDDPERKQQLLRAAHVAVLPGLGGLFIQEAQAQGIPVIAGPADGTEQDLVKAITPELYLEACTCEILAETLVRLESNPELLRTASRAVSENIIWHYNVEAMANGWAEAALAAIARRDLC